MSDRKQVEVKENVPLEDQPATFDVCSFPSEPIESAGWVKIKEERTEKHGRD